MVNDRGRLPDSPAEGNASAARRADIAIVAVIGLLWGLNWPAVKLMLLEVAPWTLRAAGFLAAAALLAGLALARGERPGPPARWRWRVALAGLLSIFGFNMLTAYGQLLTETSRAAIIAFTMPVWATVISALALGERLAGWRRAAPALGIAALALLAAEDWRGILAAPAGALVMLGAALSWAAGTVVLKALAPAPAPLMRTAGMVAVSALPALAGALALEPMPEAPSARTLWLFVFYLLGPMTLCHAAWVLLVARRPVAVATLGTLLVPVVGVLSAGWILGETLTAARLGALALVIGAIALALAPARR